MRTTPLRVVVCGGLCGAEADVVAEAVLQLPADAAIRRIGGPPAEWPQVVGAADLCIVLQGWPDEIPVSVAHALVAACSVGRLICCQGTWCASVGRTRTIWPQAVCVPIENLSLRIAFELAVLSGERTALPATASRDEAFAAHYSPPAEENSVSVLIDSPDPIYARELRHTFKSSKPVDPPECIVIDVDRAADGTTRLENTATGVAVAGFPRPEQMGALRAAGVSAIVSKLAPLSELRGAVEHAIAVRRSES